jgi:hypothetical protein
MQREMKVIGKRNPAKGGILEANGFLELVVKLRGDKPFMPRGVYRFRTHEEKDEWTLRMLSR